MSETLHLTKVIKTFPTIRIWPQNNGLPVEVSLVAQLGHGSGSHLYASVTARQRHHQEFIDELDEPSAKLAATDFAKGDATALYSFAVGAGGHPFHRHAGHRIFTAISGSAGAQLRFSTATLAQIEADPQSFINALRFINIPPDCLFTVRFGGETWHQFAPIVPGTSHPVFFALSCHTNELGGNLSNELKAQVIAGEANIPSLTELLPDAVTQLLKSATFKPQDVATTTLALDAPAGTLHRLFCNVVRGSMGILRGKWGSWYRSSGYLSHSASGLDVLQLGKLPVDALLRQHLVDAPIHYEDVFSLVINSQHLNNANAAHILAAVLEGFLANQPAGVARLMKLRNFLVAPLKLRTSSIGCPVSSLIQDGEAQKFAGKYPVIDQKLAPSGAKAEVIMGADDKHLSFRSSLSVTLREDGNASVLLMNRISCKNWFGRFYMFCIELVHRHYIAPTMLRMAVAHAKVSLAAPNRAAQPAIR